MRRLVPSGIGLGVNRGLPEEQALESEAPSKGLDDAFVSQVPVHDFILNFGALSTGTNLAVAIDRHHLPLEFPETVWRQPQQDSFGQLAESGMAQRSEGRLLEKEGIIVGPQVENSEFRSPIVLVEADAGDPVGHGGTAVVEAVVKDHDSREYCPSQAVRAARSLPEC